LNLPPFSPSIPAAPCCGRCATSGGVATDRGCGYTAASPINGAIHTQDSPCDPAWNRAKCGGDADWTDQEGERADCVRLVKGRAFFGEPDWSRQPVRAFGEGTSGEGRMVARLPAVLERAGMWAALLVLCGNFAAEPAFGQEVLPPAQRADSV